MIAGLSHDPPIHIGIATGNAFNGILGKDVGKREIVIIGECVERALLNMERAREVYGKIYVDYNTKIEAQ